MRFNRYTMEEAGLSRSEISYLQSVLIGQDDHYTNVKQHATRRGKPYIIFVPVRSYDFKEAVIRIESYISEARDDFKRNARKNMLKNLHKIEKVLRC